MPKLVLLSVQLSRYFHEKEFNGRVEVLCVVNVYGRRLWRETSRRSSAVSWRDACFDERKDEGRKERNAREGYLLPGTQTRFDGILLQDEEIGLIDRGIDFFVSIAFGMKCRQIGCVFRVSTTCLEITLGTIKMPPLEIILRRRGR